MYSFDLSAGTTRRYTITIRDEETHAIVSSYTTSDIPSARAWSGDDQATLFAPTVAWIDPTQGTLRVTIAASDTADLDPGKYPVLVTLATTDSEVVEVARFYVVVKDSPGSTEAPTTYGSYADLLLYAPWIEQLQAEADQTGFAEARHEARVWLESAIQAHYQPQSYGQGYGRYDWSGSYGGPRGRDELLQSHLDADHLVVTEQVRQIVAKRALGNILRSAIGPSEKEFSAYQRLASQFLNESESLTSGLVALVTDDNGNVIYRIGCAVISQRLA